MNAAAVAVALCVVCAAAAGPAGSRRDAVEAALEGFLDAYYERYVRPPPPRPEDLYEGMQADQPVTHNPDFLDGSESDYASIKRG